MTREIPFDTDPNDPACRCAVTQEVICIVDGDDDVLKTYPEDKLEEWRGKAAYFIPLVHNSQTEAVVATGSPIGDCDDALAWIACIRPFFNVCAAQLRNARYLDSLKPLSANLPLQAAANLTVRETEVLCLIAGGLKDAEIAAHLHILVNTVITHQRRIAEKTGRRTKQEMAVYACMTGLVTPENLSKSPE